MHEFQFSLEPKKMNNFQFSLGDAVLVLGGAVGIIVARGMWQTFPHPEDTLFYEVRTNEKTITVTEPELSAA